MPIPQGCGVEHGILTETQILGGCACESRVKDVLFGPGVEHSWPPHSNLQTNFAHMEFPEEVDCLIYGTGLAESILSASLSILGKQVLHIDRNDYYGGRLASFRFPDLVHVLDDKASCYVLCIHRHLIQPHVQKQVVTNVHGESVPAVVSAAKLQLGSNPYSPVTHPSSQWFVCAQSNGTKSSSSQSVPPPVPSLPLVLREDANLSPMISEPPDVPVSEGDEPCSIIPSASVPTVSEPALWTRDQVEQRLCRVEIDLSPRIVYAHSPTVTALLRSDVTRYLEFRFVSRCLAYTVLPDTTENTSNKPVTSESTRPNESASLFQIPVGRGELFKTRLLTLRQKRALGSFFEWCFHLELDSDARSHTGCHAARQRITRFVDLTCSSNDFIHSIAYADRSFREFLREQNRLDEFTQEMIITNLALGCEDITTREAVRRIRRLLASMNRFGPYPILWPMYGCGDLPQAYCRMSAVFGAVFCLNHSLASICPIEAQLGDSMPDRTGAANSTEMTTPRRFVAHLSNGHSVRTSCVVIGADAIPFEWIRPQISRWYARAILITDRSLLMEDRKPTDISMLAVPLSGRGGSFLDPVLLLELPVESMRRSDEALFLVHLSAAVISPLDPASLFQSVIDRLFSVEDCLTDSRPRLLWAGYFCLPDLSTVDNTVPGAVGTRFTGQNGFYLCPGLDSAFDLDSTAITAESLFNGVATHLGLSSRGSLQYAGGGGGSDGPPPSTLTSLNGQCDSPATTESTIPTPPSTTSYITLAARWDGVFPPRPPRPEEIVTSTEQDASNVSSEAD
ncbi:hypothetical protein AHF37_07179 [Paragonimus kellicotti]|nr:hypothetical protein AHF37_07179 [Paragonimus kellicotti]